MSFTTAAIIISRTGTRGSSSCARRPFSTRGRIHFRRLFLVAPILLAVRRRTIHVTPVEQRPKGHLASFLNSDVLELASSIVSCRQSLRTFGELLEIKPLVQAHLALNNSSPVNTKWKCPTILALDRRVRWR